MKRKISLLSSIFVAVTTLLILSACSSKGNIVGDWYIYDYYRDGDSILTEYENRYNISKEIMMLYYEDKLPSTLKLTDDNKFAFSLYTGTDNEVELTGSWEESVTTDETIASVYKLTYDDGTQGRIYFNKDDTKTLCIEIKDNVLCTMTKEKISLEKANEQLKLLNNNKLSISSYVDRIDELYLDNSEIEITDNITDMLELWNQLKYRKASLLLEEGNYESAKNVFSIIKSYSDASDKIIECTYGIATNYKTNGDIYEALTTFNEIKDYSDSSEQMLNISNEMIRNANLFDVVYFGSYPQDKSANVLPIKWYVLEISDDSVTLLSKYVLDSVVYNEEETDDFTWETCTLRAWLNEDFYDKAFTDNEKTEIMTTEVINSDYVESDGTTIDNGNNTTDNVWLLSYDEYENYREEYKYEYEYDKLGWYVGYPTSYADEKGNLSGFHYADPGVCAYWFRTIGWDGLFERKEVFVKYYTKSSSTSTWEANSDYIGAGVRPVIKVKIK